MSEKKQNKKEKKNKKYTINPETNPKVARYIEERIKQNEQGYCNKKEAALNAGYAKSTAHSVKGQIESTETFKKLTKNKDLDHSSILDYLSQDIKKKPQERLGELKLASEITGLKDNKYKESTSNEAVDLLREIIDNTD